MARIVYSISELHSPLSRMQELYTVIPQGHTLSVMGSPRVAFFLGDKVELVRSDGTQEPIGEGDALIAPAGAHYRIRARDQKQKVRNHVLVVTFEDEIFARSSARESKKRRPAADIQSIFSRGVRLCPGALDRGCAREVVQLLRQAMEGTKHPNPLLISGLCLALISVLATENTEDKKRSAESTRLAKGQAAVEHARQYMRQFCHEKLTLSQIAWEVQLSGEHLARLFRLHTGSTVFQYLDEIRIEKARQLLQTTDLPVVQIAPLCGFPSSTLLARHFRTQTGQTPLAYRLETRQHERFRPSEIESVPPPTASDPGRRKRRQPSKNLGMSKYSKYDQSGPNIGQRKYVFLKQ
jgi:AraC-like DNA-binding protein